MPLTHTVEEISLKNGARGLLINVPSTTTVGYEFSFRAGDEFAARPEIQQTAHILEHMMFGANERFATAEEFSQELSRNGADWNATTYDTTVDYYGTSARRDLAHMLDMWQLALTKPVFTEELLATEKDNVRAELADYANDYPQILEQRLDRALGYRGLPESEKIATIGNVTLADIREHYARTHTAKNLRFMIAGDIGDQRAEIIASLESWELPTGERLPARRETLHAAKPVCIVRPDVETIDFCLKFELNRYLNATEMDAMAMLNHLLVGTFHSRIYGRARSRGLCYDVDAGINHYFSGVSEWSFGGQVQPAKAKALFELIRDQLARVAAGELTEKEAEDARQFALGSYEMSSEAVDSLTGAYGGRLSMDEPFVSIFETPKFIQGIELNTVTKLAREFLETGIWAFGEIGNVTSDGVDRHAALFAKLVEKG